MVTTQYTSWQLRAAAELERRRRAADASKRAPSKWRPWLAALFPSYVGGGFAQRHVQLWEWVWAIKRGVRPRPFVAIWPREGGKSTSAELAVAAIGARGVRPYVWYVRETQDQADGSVSNIMDLLESSTIEQFYPQMGKRELGKFGRPRAWRRNQLRTASGFTVDAIGLDTARRGAKVKENRPGLMIFDDIDGKHDTIKATKRKIQTITTSLLPAGAQDLAVLGIQNLIIPQGVFSRLAGIADEPADFLADRIVSGPYPAVYDAEVEQVDGQFTLVGGRPSWRGQNMATCQDNINTWGYSAWLQEAQHEVDDPPGGIWDHVEFIHCDFDDVPEIVRGSVWVDPAVTSTDQSDAMGIQADGLGVDGRLYRFYSWEQITSPEDVLRRAILKCLELGFDTVGVETDQGGDVWYPVYQRVWERLVESGEVPKDARPPNYRQEKAGAGHGSKVARNQRMLVDYEHGKVTHVRGTHRALERCLKRFPKKPLDLADAGYWGWFDLMGGGQFEVTTVALRR